MTVGFAISALAIYYLLQQVSLEQLGQVLSHAQPLPIVMVIVCVTGSLVTRAARWQVYFLPEHRVPFGPLLRTLAISYMASTFLPLRAGELVRAVFLGQRARLPIPRVVGTILLEKLFDFLAIGVMLALLVTLTPLPPAALIAGTTIVSFILLGFGFVVALAAWRGPTLRLVGLVEMRLPLGLGPRLRLQDAARQFAEGTDSLRQPGLWLPLLAWTTITWLFSLGSGWGGAVALGVYPPLATLLFLTVLTSTSQAVPSSPGYVGVYQATAFFALTTFGVDPVSAGGVAVLTWVFSYASLVILGMVALWTGGYTLEDVLSAVRGRGARLPQTQPQVQRPARIAAIPASEAIVSDVPAGTVSPNPLDKSPTAR
ncbi:MAG: flippase-like domain-containing protein [Chloroflexi bacterium]|nr:flippase-like domain-containing protein [Chloroflexota bacterium]